MIFYELLILRSCIWRYQFCNWRRVTTSNFRNSYLHFRDRVCWNLWWSISGL